MIPKFYKNKRVFIEKQYKQKDLPDSTTFDPGFKSSSIVI